MASNNSEELSDDEYVPFRGPKSKFLQELEDQELEKQTQSEQKQKVLQCKDCSKTFKSIAGLTSHIYRKHTARPLPYQCRRGCGKPFCSPNQIEMHEKVCRGASVQEKPFQCTEENCEARFTQKSAVGRHLRQVHKLGDEIFTCDICGYSCVQLYVLKSHMDVHKTEHDIPCDECDELFKTPQSLYVHRIKIHREAPS